jgi:hypothetical protein
MKTNISEKIKKARKIAKIINENPKNADSADFLLKLRDKTDNLELAYSDATVKELKTQASVEFMQKLEIELEQLLLKAGQYLQNESI